MGQIILNRFTKQIYIYLAQRSGETITLVVSNLTAERLSEYVAGEEPILLPMSCSAVGS